MNKPLMSEEPETMPAPTAPPAYDDEFKPPPYNPPPYNPQMQEALIQQTGGPSASVASYPQQLYYAQPPPQQMYPQLMGMPAQTQPQPEVIVQNRRVFIGQLPVGTQPLTTVCPCCEAHITTKTKKITHCSAHLTCLLLCLVLCWCCSCLPYCMDSFHSVNHFCPNCKALVGVYHRP